MKHELYKHLRLVSLTTLASAATMLCSCAVGTSYQRANYNGDGHISAAEEYQHNRRRRVEERDITNAEIRQSHALNSVLRIEDGIHSFSRSMGGLQAIFR